MGAQRARKVDLSSVWGFERVHGGSSVSSVSCGRRS